MALDPCCNQIIGGEVFISATTPNGPWKGEGFGEIRIQPSGVERTAGASSGGSIWVVETARAPRAVLSFVNRCKSDPMELFKGRCQLDVVFIEKGRGITHEFTDALTVGNPEINLQTGEVSGIEIVGTYNTDALSSGPANIALNQTFA